jgi:hypothetical protein
MQVELLVATCKLTRIATRNTERRRCVADLFLGFWAERASRGRAISLLILASVFLANCFLVFSRTRHSGISRDKIMFNPAQVAKGGEAIGYKFICESYAA